MKFYVYNHTTYDLECEMITWAMMKVLTKIKIVSIAEFDAMTHKLVMQSRKKDEVLYQPLHK